ncbi:MAG TPA: IS1182 family transposase [Chryseosolibacter sp.]|nr:IS1182 family transposase [Chryseosolibacter sp.]
MGKITSKAVFKEYNQQQIQLLPPDLGELIPENHLVRVVNQVVERLDISSIVNQYEGGGTSAYHPKMLIKLLLYGYAMKIYTGRKIAKAVRQDITFMWLAANNRPDFRTINMFRSGILKDTVEDLFKELLLFLVDHGYVKVENYFTDGTTFRADANGRQLVWKKNSQRYKEMAEAKCQELFKEIDQLNITEDQKYGDQDLEEMGSKPVSKEAVVSGVEKLNKVIDNTSEHRRKRKAESLKKKIIEQQGKIEKYQEQLEIGQGRSGYSKTDTDASVMMMKNEELLPGYNVLASSENQFVTAITTHQNPNDATCFKEHLESFVFTPASITADSIFGTEENYQLLEGSQIESYLKYPTFHNEGTKKFKEDIFRKENFRYDAASDTYICPNSQRLSYTRTREEMYKRTGFKYKTKLYQAENCQGCQMREMCTKSKENNRTIVVNEQLDIYKAIAKSNLQSEKGLALRKRRGHEIESCFGDFKHNMAFRRFHLRGLKKVKTEVTVLAMAHNLRKIQLTR